MSQTAYFLVNLVPLHQNLLLELMTAPQMLVKLYAEEMSTQHSDNITTSIYQDKPLTYKKIIPSSDHQITCWATQNSSAK
jgi:hypothetical protein